MAVSSTGFVRWKSNPASLDRRLSSSLPQPVRATSTAPPSVGSAQTLRNFVTVHPGKPDVQEHHLGIERAGRVQSRRATMSGPDFVSTDLKHIWTV